MPIWSKSINFSMLNQQHIIKFEQLINLAFSWLQNHLCRFNKKGGCTEVAFKAEEHVSFHHTGVAYGEGLHVLGIATLTVPVQNNTYI